MTIGLGGTLACKLLNKCTFHRKIQTVARADEQIKLATRKRATRL